MSLQENDIANFVKYNRTKNGLTQEELAEKAGVGLRFIRELEQGKQTLRIDKVNQVLQLFGYTISPKPVTIQDPYNILANHVSKNVRVTLKNGNYFVGYLLLPPITENNAITGWRFVSNDDVTEYRKTNDPKLEHIIPHTDIEVIENI